MRSEGILNIIWDNIDIKKLIQDNWIIIIPFDFKGIISSLIKKISWIWYIWFDTNLDKNYINFFLSREFFFYQEAVKNNDLDFIEHVTSWDYDIEIWNNIITEKHVELKNNFVDYVKNEYEK